MNFDASLGIHTLRLKFGTRVTSIDVCEIRNSAGEVHAWCTSEHGKFYVYYRPPDGKEISHDQYLLGASSEKINEIEVIVSRYFLQFSLNDNHFLKFQCVSNPHLFPPNSFMKGGHPLVQRILEFKVNDSFDLDIKKQTFIKDYE